MCEPVVSFSWVCLIKQDGLPQKTGHFSKESSLDCDSLTKGNHNLIGFLFVEGRNVIIIGH